MRSRGASYRPILTFLIPEIRRALIATATSTIILSAWLIRRGLMEKGVATFLVTTPFMATKVVGSLMAGPAHDLLVLVRGGAPSIFRRKDRRQHNPRTFGA